MKLHNPLNERRSGILLHPTSLPGPWQSGDFSHNAYRFVEFLAAAGQSIWQMMPLGVTHDDGSPYQSLSTHAGNPLLISLDWLVERGWLESTVWEHVEHSKKWRLDTLERACKNALDTLDQSTSDDFDRFVRGQNYWLDDYANFVVLMKLEQGAGWFDWPAGLKSNDKDAVASALDDHQELLIIRKFEQYIFFLQWRELRRFAHERGVYLFGDLPIFVSGNSADVWAHRENFTVNENGCSTVVAGVPPDAFSEDGQLWGNPLYDWQALQRDDFSWWIDRLRTHFSLFDMIRIDHFRGLEACWEIPASADSAKTGQWVKAPGSELLEKIAKKFTDMPLVAEDLGIITAEVDQLRKQFSLPGMKVLQFAFDEDPDNHHLPHNHSIDTVVYTGTHDNDTTASWFYTADDQTRQRVCGYLECSDHDMPWPLVRSAMMSVAQTAIFPMQDVLGLGTGHRMNLPGTTEGNWQWRFDWSQVDTGLAERLRELTGRYSRLPDGEPIRELGNIWPAHDRRKA